MSKTAIWESLFTTDPKYTKGFKKGGGFSGTAINPTYGMLKLTEAFGVCGEGWGEEIVESRFDKGKWLSEETWETIHTIILKLWYIKGGKRFEVLGVGTTTFVGSNKHGAFTDEEYFKKTMTDALSNASKKIGLSADIFMGLYDDSKYVAEVKNKIALKAIDFPKRSEVNKILKAMTNLEDFQKYAKDFQSEYGNGCFEMDSGHKNELWKHLFGTHKDRINKVPPVNNQTPEAMQADFDSLADCCSDSETLEILERQISNNKCLDTAENWAKIDKLQGELS